jgi:hypothetical protein
LPAHGLRDARESVAPVLEEGVKCEGLVLARTSLCC